AVLSQTLQFLSLNCLSAVMTTGFPHVSPPSVERLARTSTGTRAAGIPRKEIIQTLALASKATEGSLTRSYVRLAGVEWKVVSGRKPLVNVLPPSFEVAKPMSEAPPLKKRPTWKAETIVVPNANVSGSTSVRC